MRLAGQARLAAGYPAAITVRVAMAAAGRSARSARAALEHHVPLLHAIYR